MKYITTINSNEYIVELLDDGRIKVNDKAYAADFRRLAEGGLLSLILDNRSFEAAVDSPEQDHWQVLLRGELYDIHVQDERAYRLAKARGELEDDTGTVAVKAPMPGVVVSVVTAEGTAVEKGDTVIILESMKMENELKATRDGLVVDVRVSDGDSVDKNAVLAVIGDDEDGDEA